jgi:hypothetical protein
MDLSTPKPQLWIVVYSPDPDVDATSSPSRPIVGFADGTARVLQGRMVNELRNQNVLRAQFKLPPLPDPYTITHGQPARAGASTGGGAAPSGASEQD